MQKLKVLWPSKLRFEACKTQWFLLLQIEDFNSFYMLNEIYSFPNREIKDYIGSKHDVFDGF